MTGIVFRGKNTAWIVINAFPTLLHFHNSQPHVSCEKHWTKGDLGDTDGTGPRGSMTVLLQVNYICVSVCDSLNICCYLF